MPESKISTSINRKVRATTAIVYDINYFFNNSKEGYSDYTDTEKWVSGIVDDIESVYGSVSGLDILDVGCAFGYLTNELASRGAVVIGVDSSAYAISQAQIFFPTLDFRVESIDNLSITNNKIDLIVALGIFDCLANQIEIDNSMIELDRVLRAQGKMYILSSEESNWYTVLTSTSWQSSLSNEFGGLWTIQDVGDQPLLYDWRIIKVG